LSLLGKHRLSHRILVREADSDPSVAGYNYPYSAARNAVAGAGARIRAPAVARRLPHRLVPLTTTSTSDGRSCGKANNVPPGFRSPAGAGCVSTAGDRSDRIRRNFIRSASTRIAGRNLTITPALVAQPPPYAGGQSMFSRIDPVVSGSRGTLAGDVLLLAPIAYIFAIVFGILG
jgi:hypothetical protein